MDKEIIKELIQDDLTTDNLVTELHLILGKNRPTILKNYKILQEILGGEGASLKASKIIYDSLR